ncbi:hypothetical protein MTO96_028276 [Rhipicephalus appendiculatus]
MKNKSLPDGLVSTLSLPGAQREHSGVYVCEVANDYGQDEKHIRLIVQGSEEVETESSQADPTWTEREVSADVPSVVLGGVESFRN